MLFLARYSRSNPALFDTATNRRITYGELIDSVEALSAELEPDRKALVFCFMRNDAVSVENYLAAMHAGHAVALLDPAVAPEFQQQLIDLYRPDWILGRGNTRIERTSTNASHAIHPNLSLLLSTSGSTGSAKLVRLTLDAVRSNAESIREALRIDERERPITSLPLHYSYGLSVLNSHLAAGAEIVLTDEKLISGLFWDQFRGRECTSFAGVPYSYQILRRLDPAKLNLASLRHMTQAGGRLEPQLVSHFHAFATERGIQFWVMYGQTEATARISVLPAEDLPEKLGSAGKPVRGGAMWTDAESGELFYRGPNVMMGYATGPDDLGRGDDNGGVLATGDLGHIDADGYIYVTGRSKRIAKVMGYRVNLDEVEQIVRRHVHAAVVAGDNRLVIFCEQGEKPEFEQLSMRLADTLKLHYRCFEFQRLERLPVNANGKIDYPRLQEGV
jgi:long-chain acyl-CoA synthetase